MHGPAPERIDTVRPQGTLRADADALSASGADRSCFRSGAHRELIGSTGTVCGHDTAQQQPRAEPRRDENGITAQRSKPTGCRGLLQPDNSLHSPVSYPDRQVQRDRQGRDMFSF